MTRTPFWRDPAWWMRWLAPLGALAVSFIITLRAHLHYFVPYATPVSNDEGYISALAIRLIQGHWLPYVDGISQRGPVLYWLAALAMRVGGIFSWYPIRVLALTMALSTVTLTFAVALELFTPMAAAVASLMVTYLLSYELNPWDGVGYNGEVVAMQFVLASFFAVARAQRGDTRNRDRWLIAAGALGALAGLSKQVALIHTLPALAWVLVGRRGVSETRRERSRDVVRYGLGFAAPYVLVIGLYAVTGHLREFFYYYQRHGREVFMAPVTPEFMREKVREQIDKYYLGIAGFASIGIYALARAVAGLVADTNRGVERWRNHAPQLFMIAQLACGALGASFTWRFFPHYFVQVHPIAALVTGMTFGSMATLVAPLSRSSPPDTPSRTSPPGPLSLSGEGEPTAQGLNEQTSQGSDTPSPDRERGPGGEVREGVSGGELRDDPLPRARRRAAFVGSLLMVAGASVLLFIGASALSRNVRIRRETDRWYQDPSNDPIVRYVLERSSPSRPLFVWGFRAETYVSARRMPASRFVYTVYPSGVVPWFQSTRDEEERRVVPGSREQLLRDLEATKPELVVDAGRSMNGRYMYNYPPLRNYLDRNYCFMRYVDGEPVYRRREGEHCPPADY